MEINIRAQIEYTLTEIIAKKGDALQPESKILKIAKDQ